MRRSLLCIVMILACCTPARAQDDAQPQPSATSPTTTWVNEQISSIEAREDLDEAAQTAIVDIYNAALEFLKQADADRASAAEFKRLQEAASDQLAAINAELATTPAPPTLTIPADPAPLSPDEATTAQLDNMLAQASADFDAAREGERSIDEEIDARQQRSSEIPSEIAALNQRIEALTEAIDSRVGVTGDQPVAELARQAAEREAAQAKVAALTAENESYAARGDLIAARLERAKRRVAQADKRVKAWQPIVEARREADAAQAAADVQEAARQAARKHHVLDTFARGTAELADRQITSESPKRRSDAGSQRNAIRDQHLLITERFQALQRDIKDLGMSRATGLLARSDLQDLPEDAELRRQAARIERSLGVVVEDLVEIDQARERVADIEATVQELVDRIRQETPQANVDVLESEARSLVQQRRAFLDSYYAELDETKKLQKQSLKILREDQVGLIDLVDEYRRYIEVRIFWVRSVTGSNLPDIGDAMGSLAWLFEPDAWAIGIKRSVVTVRARPLGLGGLALVVALLVGARFWARRELERRAELVSRYRTDSMVHTVVASALTAVHVAFWPLVFVLVAAFLRVHGDEDPPQQVEAFAHGLIRGLHTLIPLELLRQLSRPHGLLDAHFAWPSAGLKRARRWLTFLGIPLIALQVIVGAMEAQPNVAWTESIGRLAFIVGELIAVVGFILILSPSSPIVSALLSRDSANIARKTRYFWYPLAICLPLALAVLSTLGFHSTATKIDTRLIDTVFFIALLAAANGMLMRWLFLAQRRIAIDEARRKLSAAEDGEDERSLDEEAIDVPAISQKTRLLFGNVLVVMFFVGLAMIWTDVLPALRFLDRIELYPNPGMTELETPDALEELSLDTTAQPEAEADAPESAEPAATPTFPGVMPPTTQAEPSESGEPFRLSAADVGAALISLIITFFVFQNFPAFVEIVLLQRLPMDAGSRYALSTILKYIIAMVGAIVVFGALGLSWSQVQFLAAALTFGLAFGLQEIVANFVSGLIMLVERPVRVGDTVTVEGVSGTVTRIRMRATTILDWDRKELVIPNKTFITSQVINWTLSDTVLRIICPVSVAYSSDIEKVRRALLEAASSHDKAMKDPAPRALFRKYGESALEFELRFYVPHIDDLLSVTDEMYTSITEAFRKAEIELAYRQIDVHMRETSEMGGLIKPMSRSEARNDGS